MAVPAPLQGFYSRTLAGSQRWIIPARGGLPTPSQGFYGRIIAGLQRWIIPTRGAFCAIAYAFAGLLWPHLCGLTALDHSYAGGGGPQRGCVGV